MLFNIIFIFTATRYPKKRVRFADVEERLPGRLDMMPPPPPRVKEKRPLCLLDLTPPMPPTDERMLLPKRLVFEPPPNKRAALALERLFGPKRQVISFKPRNGSK